jgi:hypothetical protein
MFAYDFALLLTLLLLGCYNSLTPALSKGEGANCKCTLKLLFHHFFQGEHFVAQFGS